MAFAILRNLLCCCRREQPEIDGSYDENSRLIPQTVEPPAIYPNVVLVDHQKLQERLGLIVRAKEGKMVNVASQIPFNLHNQVIPVENSKHSNSRSVSASEDKQYGQRQPYPSYGNPYGHAPPSRSRSRSLGPQVGPSHGTRSQSPTSVQPKPTPILNLRLVGYMDTRARGRTRDRGSHPTGLPSSANTKGQNIEESSASTPVTDVASDGGEATPTQHSAIPTAIKFYDTGPITISWSD
ncbi:hypothetical protein BDZ97DRAFT_1803853 [Flammula alnicola]|nr:hypothetical protein BDZ97DRAFT_1803853 [Flammula alnicola]